jgi:hypothetical protein
VSHNLGAAVLLQFVFATHRPSGEVPSLRSAHRIDTGLPGPVTSKKIPSNRSFIHGRIAIRAINLRRVTFGTRFAGIDIEHAKNTFNQRKSD